MLVEVDGELSAVKERNKKKQKTCENMCAHKQEAVFSGCESTESRGAAETESALTGEDVGVSVLLLVVVLVGLLVSAGGRAARQELRGREKERKKERRKEERKKKMKQQQTRWSVKTTVCTGCKGAGLQLHLLPHLKASGSSRLHTDW